MEALEVAPRAGATTLAFECHGVIIGVRADEPELLVAVAGALPVGARLCRLGHASALYTLRSGEGGRAGHRTRTVTVHCSHQLRVRMLARTTDIGAAATVLRHDAEFRVALHAPDHLFLHAAALAWKERVIVVPGHSHAGKSTLAAALVRAGARYLSDEYAVLGPDGLVHPFARHLHLRSRDGGPSADVPVEALGGNAVLEPLPLGMVVSTMFRPGARWRPGRMTAGQTALALFERAIVARVRPAHAMARIAAAMGDDVVGLRGVRGEADETARAILRRADRELTGSSPHRG